jgi:hypothetical protein
LTPIEAFHPHLRARCPATHAVLVEGRLVLHDAVERVTLHGSRGHGGRPRTDSDVDLALRVSDSALRSAPDPAALLRAVLTTTLERWCGALELDLAAVFDRGGCGLGCLTDPAFDVAGCTSNGSLGVFKVQRGFDGFVEAAAVDCRRLQPIVLVWARGA